jgi:hypothetical protein
MQKVPSHMTWRGNAMDEHIFWLAWDANTARKQGVTAMQQRQHKRLAEMVAFARSNSPIYAKLYQYLPATVDDPNILPVTNKKELMAHFDSWVTDRRVTLEHVRAFVENPEMIG